MAKPDAFVSLVSYGRAQGSTPMIQDPIAQISFTPVARTRCRKRPLSQASRLALLQTGTTAAQLIDPLRMQESRSQTPEFNAILVADDDEQLATALQWILA